MINREELSRLGRHFPLVHKRQSLESSLECDDSYVDNNLEAAVWMLENSELFFELLVKYRRITEITFEGEKLSE